MGFGNSFRASPEGGQRRGGRVTRRRGGGRGCSVGVRSGAEEEERGAGEVRDSSGVVGVAFIGPGEGCRGGEGGVMAGKGAASMAE
jgi:hypothetical protein